MVTLKKGFNYPVTAWIDGKFRTYPAPAVWWVLGLPEWAAPFKVMLRRPIKSGQVLVTHRNYGVKCNGLPCCIARRRVTPYLSQLGLTWQSTLFQRQNQFITTFDPDRYLEQHILMALTAPPGEVMWPADMPDETHANLLRIRLKYNL